MSEEHSIPDVAAALNERIEDLALHLLGKPNRALSTRSQLRYGSKGSVAVDIAGDKAGKWYDHESGTGGDGLALVCHVMNLHNGRACDWARNWLGLSQGSPIKITAPASPEKPEDDKAEKVADILKGCGSIEGTPAERYLKRRGITAIPPACIQFRPYACAGYGALVAQATDENGNVLAFQQIYLTDSGQKAPVKIVKRTNKAVEKWAEKSAVRLPGAPPIILAEGAETALSLWRATGQETWACLGISNIGSAPAPEGAEVIVARDGDPAGSKADNQIKRAVAKLRTRGISVAVAAPPEGKDFNDLLRSDGGEAVRAMVMQADPGHSVSQDQARTVFIGSDDAA